MCTCVCARTCVCVNKFISIINTISFMVFNSYTNNQAVKCSKYSYDDITES